MKNWILTLLLLLIVGFAIGFFSKPEDQECLMAAEPVLSEQIKDKMPDKDFNFVLVENLAKLRIKKGLSVNDKLLYKEIKFTLKGITKTIGYGYLWTVHIIEEN